MFDRQLSALEALSKINSNVENRLIGLVDEPPSFSVCAPPLWIPQRSRFHNTLQRLCFETFYFEFSKFHIFPWNWLTLALIGCFIFTVGVILQTASTALGLLVAGRLIAGFGVGFVSAIIILYMVCSCSLWFFTLWRVELFRHGFQDLSFSTVKIPIKRHTNKSNSRRSPPRNFVALLSLDTNSALPSASYLLRVLTTVRRTSSPQHLIVSQSLSRCCGPLSLLLACSCFPSLRVILFERASLRMQPRFWLDFADNQKDLSSFRPSLLRSLRITSTRCRSFPRVRILQPGWAASPVVFVTLRPTCVEPFLAHLCRWCNNGLELTSSSSKPFAHTSSIANMLTLLASELPSSRSSALSLIHSWLIWLPHWSMCAPRPSRSGSSNVSVVAQSWFGVPWECWSASLLSALLV